MELKEGIKQINQSVTQSSASDATLEGYMLELKDANGNLVDKQPVSKIESLVYNYLTTKRQSELAKVMSAQESLGGANDNVFILFHKKGDSLPVIVNPRKWTSFQNSGEVAAGVVVVAGGRILVVAPTETSAYWSSAAVSGGGKTTTDLLTAFGDFEGQANTAAQITHPEASGASYAPGFCAQYSRTNANGQGLTAGSWWLPSLGELMMMYANMRKINYALSFIEGATQLAETWYWNSTEYYASFAWALNFYDGNVSKGPKATDQGKVRPVSSISLNLPSFYKDYPNIASLAKGVGSCCFRGWNDSNPLGYIKIKKPFNVTLMQSRDYLYNFVVFMSQSNVFIGNNVTQDNAATSYYIRKEMYPSQEAKYSIDANYLYIYIPYSRGAVFAESGIIETSTQEEFEAATPLTPNSMLATLTAYNSLSELKDALKAIW